MKLRVNLLIVLCFVVGVLCAATAWAGETDGTKGLAGTPVSASALQGTSKPIATDIDGRMSSFATWQRAQQVFTALSGALEPKQRKQVRGVTLVEDRTSDGINAEAACVMPGKRTIVIQRGLLTALAGLSEAAAYDALHPDATTTRVHLDRVARAARAGRPIPQVSEDLIDSTDGRDIAKRRLQTQFFEESVAFVLAHEIAHHVSDDVPCLEIRTMQDLAMWMYLASERRNEPGILQQIRELAADKKGLALVLAARKGGVQMRAWSRGGAIRAMSLFASVDPTLYSAGDVDELSTHPHPRARLEQLRKLGAQVRDATDRGVVQPLRPTPPATEG